MTKTDKSQKAPSAGTCEFCGGALRPCTDGPGYECEKCGNFLPYDADGEPICYLPALAVESVKATHTETITVRGIAGDTVEDLQGNLWRLKDLDRYTLAEIRPGTSLEIRWTGPQGIRGPLPGRRGHGVVFDHPLL